MAVSAHGWTVLLFSQLVQLHRARGCEPQMGGVGLSGREWAAGEAVAGQGCLEQTCCSNLVTGRDCHVEVRVKMVQVSWREERRPGR